MDEWHEHEWQFWLVVEDHEPSLDAHQGNQIESLDHYRFAKPNSNRSSNLTKGECSMRDYSSGDCRLEKKDRVQLIERNTSTTSD